MIDDEATIDDGRLALLYDWFKHLTSLSLLTLGGVLALVQGDAGVPIKRALLVVVLAFVVTSGLLAFSCAALVVKSRTEGVPLPRSLPVYQAVIGFALSGAVGAFVYIFVSTLK